MQGCHSITYINVHTFRLFSLGALKVLCLRVAGLETLGETSTPSGQISAEHIAL